MTVKFEISPEEFNINFMKEHRYVRKKCRYCGSYFWTVKEDREDCGEPPCSNYYFLNNPPTRKKYSLSEMRNAFLKFFEKYGHTILDPYPVVARWRDDLLITIASIADFQPFVTSGISDPPANPLVISQPCLRFEDIHNVGLTAGRHLTIFEMGGAHAFNKKDGKYIYWKNETVNYHHLFATEELGVSSDEIIYKEHFWVGGGNAGPDLEGIIRGLEVSTLVFMQYKIINDTLEETPILTVDTGYGMERWAWLSTGDPTAFHVIYGDLVNKILKWSGLEIEEKILYEDTLYSGGYRADNIKYVKKMRQILANKHGYPPDELITKLNHFNVLMASLDHLKGAIFLISDGALPSNVREGYLTRLLLRRWLRIVELYNLVSYIDKLINSQIALWGKDFPNILDASNTIAEVIFMEYDRYRKILNRGKEIIRGIIKKRGGIYLDDLILLYDSHGIPPDYVSEVAEKLGISVKVPHDFHAQVVARHQKELVTTPTKPYIKLDVQYRTERVYYTDMYQTEVDAHVLWADENFLILDKTVFYPGGGGQLNDTGYIIKDDKKFKVVDIQIINENIVHVLDQKVVNIQPGDRVKCMVDWRHRYSLMCHHTATHIVMGAVKRVLGRHIWQAGAEKRPDQSRLDITHYKFPSKDEIKKIEELANKIIRDSIDVKVEFLERGAAERMFGPQIYQGGVVPGRYVRIVRVGDWEVEACGGLHVKNTSEVKIIKIIGVDRPHEGIVRLIFKSGDEAIKYLHEANEIINMLVHKLSVSREEIIERIDNILSELNELRRKAKTYASIARRYRADELYEKSKLIKNIKLVINEFRDVEEAIEIGEYLEKRYDNILYLGLVNMKRGFSISIFSGKRVRDKGLGADIIIKTIKNKLRGGGKGDARYYRFGGPGKISIKNLESWVVKIVK